MFSFLGESLCKLDSLFEIILKGNSLSENI